MNKLAALPVLTLIALSPPPQATAADAPLAMPGEHVAVYDVLRGGKAVGKVTLELSRVGDTWTYLGFTHDMQGIAKVLNVKGRQRVTGQWDDDRFQPDTFEFSFSLIGFRDKWRAEFDWPAGIMTTGKKSRQVTLPLDGGAMDPLSLFLNTGLFLAAGHQQMTVEVIDKDEIEPQVYEAQTGVPLETKLGCLDTTRVERIRKNAKRTSLAWYAVDHGYLPVKLHHSKKKGKGMQVSIVSLSIEGRDVPPGAPCMAEAG